MLRIRLGLVLLAGLLPISSVRAQAPEILSTQPARHASGVSAAAAIVIEFNENMTTATVNDSTLRVYGTLSGLHGGTMSWAMQQSELTLTPTRPFELGELVTVIVTTGAESAGGVPLDESYTWTFTITAGAVSETFGPAFKYPLSDWPHQMVAGDFNGDGALDVLVAIGSHTGDVTVYTGDGTGALIQGASYVLPSRAEYLTTVDLDADGDLEIVARHATVPYVSVMWNVAGSFTVDSLHHSGVFWAGNTNSIESADINGDGQLDLLTGEGAIINDWSSLNLLFNGGDSAFTHQELGFQYLGAVKSTASADLDGDGDLDVATSNWLPSQPGLVLVLLNDGTGLLGLDSSYVVGANPGYIAGADFDSDGDWDLAVSNRDDATLSILVNDGSAQFSVDTSYVTPSSPDRIEIVDIDADGDPDLLLQTLPAGWVSLFENDGAGGFTIDTTFELGFYGEVVPGDYDRDGDVDFVAIDDQNNELHVLLYQMRPQIAGHTPPSHALSVPVNTTVDINFDMPMDGSSITGTALRVDAQCTGSHGGLLTYNDPTRALLFNPTADFHAGERVSVYLDDDFKSATGAGLAAPYQWQFTTRAGLASGAFAPGDSYEAGAGGTDLCVADFDNDGDLDVCTADRNDHTFSVFSNDGSGYLNLDSAFVVASEPHSICAADFDRDGDMDVATANRTQNRVQVWRNDGTGVFSGDTLYVMGLEPTSLAPADYDGDGYIDLAVAHAGGNNIGILFNAGDGTFVTRDGGYGVGNPSIVTSTDVDNDGDMDIAAASWNGRHMAVLRNNGDGTFAPVVPYVIGLGGSGTVAGDLNGDGYADLMCVDHYDSTISVLMNSGDGTFEDRFTLKIGQGPYRVEPADIDGDGDLDLAALNYYNDNVPVFFNDGLGNFTFESNHTVDAGPMSMFVADLNGDGALDVATSCYSSGMLSVLLNNPWICPVTVPGDQDSTAGVTASDIVYLINYILKGGPDPMPCAAVSDLNCSGEASLADVIYLVNYVFKGGPEPCDVCTLMPGTWTCP